MVAFQSAECNDYFCTSFLFCGVGVWPFFLLINHDDGLRAQTAQSVMDQLCCLHSCMYLSSAILYSSGFFNKRCARNGFNDCIALFHDHSISLATGSVSRPKTVEWVLDWFLLHSLSKKDLPKSSVLVSCCTSSNLASVKSVDNLEAINGSCPRSCIARCTIHASKLERANKNELLLYYVPIPLTCCDNSFY